MSVPSQGFGREENRRTAYTGNLNVLTIQHSPIGTRPNPDFVEPLPSVDNLKRLRDQGLTGYEDYVCWGTAERVPGAWDWGPHRRVLERVKAAGLQYVVYPWLQFPPVWYSERHPMELMRCLEHDTPTRVVTPFSPRTLDQYRRFYHEIAAQFGDSVDIIYGSLNGPYGEGNFPLPNVDPYVNQLHSHEGWWIGDAHARADFRAFCRRLYRDVGDLNAAWGTEFQDFADIEYPLDFCLGNRALAADAMSVAERRRWLDFVEWQQNVLPAFARRVAEIVLEFFPAEKVKLKPGGSAGGMNRISWGTNCPAFARQLAGLGVGLQPADAHGAVFGDKWIYTAYRHYGIPFSSETAGAIDRNGQVRRIFSDASAGAMQLFTYEYGEKHAETVQQYLHLFQGRYPRINVAVYAPITDYRLGGDPALTYRGAELLRDLTDFDVLDELLIRDGFLSEYSHLVVFQAEWMEREAMEAIREWMDNGGITISFRSGATRTVEEDRSLDYTHALHPDILRSPEEFRTTAALLPEGPDMAMDGLWVTVYRDGAWLLYNDTDHAIEREFRDNGSRWRAVVEARAILEHRPAPGRQATRGPEDPREK